MNGTKQILSAKEPPQQPVLVITPCEHHGDHSLASPKALSKATSPSSGVWRLTIYHFYLYDDNEGWPNGDAEIYVKIEDNGWKRTDCYTINDEGYYENYNKPLDPDWSFMPSGKRKFDVWEDDWSSGDDLVDKYWHSPFETSEKSRLVDVSTTNQYWYYGDGNEADLYMGMDYY